MPSGHFCETPVLKAEKMLDKPGQSWYSTKANKEGTASPASPGGVFGPAVVNKATLPKGEITLSLCADAVRPRFLIR